MSDRPASRSKTPARPRPLARFARALVALASLAAIALAITHLGAAAFVTALRRAAPWLPILLLLEGARIAADGVALRALCGADGAKLPLRAWMRMQIVANAALVVLPAGRMVSEGVKIARLRGVLGAGRATALVVVLHVTTLLGIAIVSALAALAALLSSLAHGPLPRSPLLALALLAHAVTCLVGALALRRALERARLPRAVSRWTKATGPALDELRASARALPWIPPAALAAKLVNRAAQVAQFAVLLTALGAALGPGAALVASGASLLGGVVSDLSFASIGATDGALAWAAPALSTGVATALAVAAVSRGVSLAWSAVGSVVAAL